MALEFMMLVLASTMFVAITRCRQIAFNVDMVACIVLVEYSLHCI